MRRSLAAIALALVFGGADQLLGARAWVVGAWAVDASLLSAPWLLVAFVAGWAQASPRRAVVLGFTCTIAALAGYSAMTLSPLEGAVVTSTGVRGLLAGQGMYAAGALVTGPLFGWFGNRWRTHRDQRGALVAALAVCCEPLAHAAAGTAVGFHGVWAAEVVAGLGLALYVAGPTVRRGAA
jgi:hypothetical protein